MPGKIVIIGIGVSDASHINDLSKPRSSGDEYGVEILKRMLKPFGWRVETVYFDSRLTYHIDCLMMLIDEGIIGLPDDGKHGLWTALPKEFEKWEIIDIPVKEQQIGVCNNEVIGNKRVLMTEGAKQMNMKSKNEGTHLLRFLIIRSMNILVAASIALWDAFGGNTKKTV